MGISSHWLVRFLSSIPHFKDIRGTFKDHEQNSQIGFKYGNPGAKKAKVVLTHKIVYFSA